MKYNKIQISNRMAQKMVKRNMSLLERRLFTYVLGCVKPPTYTQGEPLLEYTLDIREFCEKAGYTYGCRSIKTISNTLFQMAQEEEWESQGEFVYMGKLFERVWETEWEDVFIVFLNVELEAELFHLKSYVSFQEEIVYRFNKKLTQTIYLLCKSWQKRGSFEIRDTELMMLLDAKGKKDSYHLKKNVINPALEEINSLSDIRVSYEDIKKDRKTTSAYLFRVSVRRETKEEEAEENLEAVMKQYELTEKDVIRIVHEHCQERKTEVNTDVSQFIPIKLKSSEMDEDVFW